MEAVDAGLQAAASHIPDHPHPLPPPPPTHRDQHLERQLLEASEQFQKAISHVHNLEQHARGLEEQMEAMQREYARQ